MAEIVELGGRQQHRLPLARVRIQHKIGAVTLDETQQRLRLGGPDMAGTCVVHDVEPLRIRISARIGDSVERKREEFLAAAPADQRPVEPAALRHPAERLVRHAAQVVRRNRPPVHVHAGQHDKPVVPEQGNQPFVTAPEQVGSVFQKLDQIHRKSDALGLGAVDSGAPDHRRRQPGAAEVARIRRRGRTGRPVRLRRRLRKVAVEHGVHGEAARRPRDDLTPAAPDRFANRPDLPGTHTPVGRARLQTIDRSRRKTPACQLFHRSDHGLSPPGTVLNSARISSSAPGSTGSRSVFGASCQTLTGADRSGAPFTLKSENST